VELLTWQLLKAKSLQLQDLLIRVAGQGKIRQMLFQQTTRSIAQLEAQKELRIWIKSKGFLITFKGLKCKELAMLTIMVWTAKMGLEMKIKVPKKIVIRTVRHPYSLKELMSAKTK